MERLTQRNEKGEITVENVSAALEKLTQYEDAGLSPNKVRDIVAVPKNLLEYFLDIADERGNPASTLINAYDDWKDGTLTEADWRFLVCTLREWVYTHCDYNRDAWETELDALRYIGYVEYRKEDF